MRLTNCFLPILALFCLGLPACSGSDDIIPGEKEPTVPEKKYDAVFSMAIQQNRKSDADTKAAGGRASSNWKSHDYITNLNLIVFDADEQLVAFKEAIVPQEDASAFGIRETDTLHVPSGRVKVLVLANVDIAPELKRKGTSLRDFGALRGTLDEEVVGKLSMSSDLMTFDLRTGWNFAGFGQKGNTTVTYKGNEVQGLELTGRPVKLVRNISSVFLNGLELQPSADFKGYGEVVFHLKSLFVANVKTVSKIFDPAGDKWGSVEVPSSEAEWASGAFGDQTGALKENEGRVRPSLFYDFVTPPVDVPAYNELYFYLKGYWDFVLREGYIDGRDKEGNLSPVRLVCKAGDDKAQINLGNGAGMPVGVDFYVYENKSEEDDHTLLVVCGDYTYTPVKGQPPVTLKDRYYTVVVNKDGKNEDLDPDAEVHTYIRKNYKYAVNLTVAGTGSDSPYDKLSTAHVSAQIKVRDWDEVNMDPSVD